MRPDFDVLWTFWNIVWLVLVIAEATAFIDAALRPAQAFVAAGKLTKGMWLLILAAALAVGALLGVGIGLLGLAAVVATIVYFVDVRPALREVGGSLRFRR